LLADHRTGAWLRWLLLVVVAVGALVYGSFGWRWLAQRSRSGGADRGRSALPDLSRPVGGRFRCSSVAGHSSRHREPGGAGRSDGQIRQYFVARYTTWILLDPPRRGLTLVTWIAPIVAFAAAVATVTVRFVRRRPGRAEPTDEVRALVAQALASSEDRAFTSPANRRAWVDGGNPEVGRPLR